MVFRGENQNTKGAKMINKTIRKAFDNLVAENNTEIREVVRSSLTEHEGGFVSFVVASNYKIAPNWRGEKSLVGSIGPRGGIKYFN
jgi:hypothetical protein